MLPDSDKTRAWLALRCAPDGTIEEVLRNDLGSDASPGDGLADLMEGDSRVSAETFIATARTGEAVAGWPLAVRIGAETRRLYFAAASTTDCLVVLAAPDPASLADLYDQLERTSRGSLSALRPFLQPQRTGITAALNRDNVLYEELSRLNNDLINRERELARKTAALERVAAERNRMVAIAAHDLRNPLTVIASYADLLRLEHAVAGEYVNYVEEISRSARFMMELVEEMLESAHLESGHLEIDLRPLNLVAAAEHASVINRMRAERKDITIVLERQTDEAMIMADPVKLRQIINNLAVNAIKFSAHGTMVTIRVGRDGSRAMLEVEDQGVGIAPDKVAAIFEPFKILLPEGTGGEKSTGLGLSIVKQFVELHNGTIEVESFENRGSLFRVYFPLLP